MTPAGAEARFVPVDQHNEAQAASWALSTELVGEVAAADTILLGLPLYNFGPPSTVKAWVDHLIAPGLSMDLASGDGLLGGREMIVLAARGGGYAEGTPREGWDHAQPWQLTLADVNPAIGRPARARRGRPEGGGGRGRRALGDQRRRLAGALPPSPW
jgi:FMN-dependent NADH-azoreductase